MQICFHSTNIGSCQNIFEIINITPPTTFGEANKYDQRTGASPVAFILRNETQLTNENSEFFLLRSKWFYWLHWHVVHHLQQSFYMPCNTWLAGKISNTEPATQLSITQYTHHSSMHCTPILTTRKKGNKSSWFRNENYFKKDKGHILECC